MNKNRKFCVLFITKNYYPFFKECLYKHSKADWNEVLILNADLDSTEQSLKKGIEVCNQLDIKHIGSVSCTQEALKLADEFLTKNNIDVNWIMHFEHDVVPVHENFWDKVDYLIENTDGIDDMVGTWSSNSYHFGLTDPSNPTIPNRTSNGKTKGGSYEHGLKMLNEDRIKRNKFGTNSGRSCLLGGVDNSPYNGYYRYLPDLYYEVDYYVIESANWTSCAFNRKLFRECIVVDDNFIFNLWPDDISHQFMSNGYVNITFNDLFSCHDLNFSSPINIPSDYDWKRNAGNPHDRFFEKHGFHWGIRNKNLREEYSSFLKQNSSESNSIQKKIFNSHINDGPLRIEDFV